MHLLLVDPFQPILSEEGIFQRYKIVGVCIKLHLSESVHGEEGMLILCPRLKHSYSIHGSVQTISGTVGNTVYSPRALLQTRHRNTLFWPDSRSTKAKGDRALKCIVRGKA